MCGLQKVVKNYSESQRSSNAYSTKKNVMRGITNILRTERRSMKKKHYGRSYQKFQIFFNAIMNWTRLLISSKIEASFMLPFVIKPPSLLYLIAALSGHITHQASLTFGIKNCTESSYTKWKQADNNLHKRKPCAIRFAFHLFPQFNFPVFCNTLKVPNKRTCTVPNIKMAILSHFWGHYRGNLRSF